MRLLLAPVPSGSFAHNCYGTICGLHDECKEKKSQVERADYVSDNGSRSRMVPFVDLYIGIFAAVYDGLLKLAYSFLFINTW